MSTYSSNDVTLNASAEVVFKKFSNLEGLHDAIANIPADRIPDDKRDMLENIEITSDSISLPAGPMGSLTLRVTQKIEPTLIALEAENSPIPINISFNIRPIDAESCSAKVDIELNVPMMLAPMVNGPMKKMAEQISVLLASIPF